MQYTAEVAPAWSLDAWRSLARLALRAQIPPEAIDWSGAGQASLLPTRSLQDAAPLIATPAIPSAFIDLAAEVLCHRDSQCHALLYRVLWRIAAGERALLERSTDADVYRLLMMRKSVHRDTHKMKAFTRFREVPGEDNAFVAWFEPEHFIVERVAPFFRGRFAGMRWAIVTPYCRVAWDGNTLTFGGGGRRADAPADDAREELWRTYFSHIYNPARANPRMMQQEMPKRYWKHLPEARLIPELLNQSAASVSTMLEREATPPRRRIPKVLVLPPALPQGLDALRQALQRCRGCELWQPATQAVMGEGPARARILFLGEQPGDQEDLLGRPFVGPAGRLFDQALREIGIARESVFITNAVKHFRFEQRGKARLHNNPLRRHAEACSGWLAQEIALVRPERIVCLGAVAAEAIFGRGFRLEEERGQWFDLAGGIRAMATLHPAALLRLSDKAQLPETFARWVGDLRSIGLGNTAPLSQGVGLG